MKTKKQIVVLDRGRVYIGDVTTDERGIRIDDASCIRRWGTTSELEQIAKHGPTPQTILEPTGTMHAPWSAVIASIDCSYRLQGVTTYIYGYGYGDMGCSSARSASRTTFADGR